MTAIDFFCGAGGASAGIAGIYDVVAAVNHDPHAVECHTWNHPQADHYNDDVRKVSETELAARYGHVNAIWWSAECTHFSVAKGGQPRDADSRMLNDELYRFVEALKPDRIYVENVREFLTWGPLVERDGKLLPDPDREGEDYYRWVRTIERMGYQYDYRVLDSADYGAYTSRERYFGIFAKVGLPIHWPAQTHSRDPQASSLFDGEVEKWRAAREVLNLDDHGQSIFTRKRPLVPATLRRIAFGINRFAPAAEREPLQFLLKYYGSGNGAVSLEEPVPTITTNDRFALVTAQWLDKQYGSGPQNVADLDRPVPTITTNPKLNLVTAQFISKQWSGASNVGSVDQPVPTIATAGAHSLVTAGTTPDGLRDIKMRMLSVSELARAQGFPENYILPQSSTLAKKFIGNSVVPQMAHALASAQHQQAVPA